MLEKGKRKYENMESKNFKKKTEKQIVFLGWLWTKKMFIAEMAFF